MEAGVLVLSNGWAVEYERKRREKVCRRGHEKEFLAYLIGCMWSLN